MFQFDNINQNKKKCSAGVGFVLIFNFILSSMYIFDTDLCTCLQKDTSLQGEVLFIYLKKGRIILLELSILISW